MAGGSESNDPLAGPWPLVAAHEPAPFAWLNPRGQAPLVVLVDHAGNAVPQALDGLGLDPAERGRHIAFDPGAWALAEALCQRLGAVGVAARYSRLLVDPNRAPDDPTAIPAIADGTVVDGNRNLDGAAVEARLASFFRPYHAACEAALARQAERGGKAPAVVAVHSFTPQLGNGARRPWEVGVLWHRANPLAQGLIDALRAPGDVTVGDNEPYDARNAHGYTLERHSDPQNLDTALIEVRNDQLAETAGVAAWAERLAAAVRAHGYG